MSAVQLGKAFGQGEPETGPLLRPAWPGIELLELDEQPAQVRISNADSSIPDGDFDPRIDLASANRHSATIRRELDAVGNEGQKHLLQLGRVRHEVSPRIQFAVDGDLLGPGQWLDRSKDYLDALVDPDLL